MLEQPAVTCRRLLQILYEDLSFQYRRNDVRHDAGAMSAAVWKSHSQAGTPPLLPNMAEKCPLAMQQFDAERPLSFRNSGLAGAEMFAVGLSDVFHQRILIVENDPSIAASLMQFVEDNGGVVVAHVGCASKALALVGAEPDNDAVFVEADMENDLALPLVRQLERRRMHTVWVIGHDGYFVPASKGDPTALVYRLAGDPDNVMRVSVDH